MRVQSPITALPAAAEKGETREAPGQLQDRDRMAPQGVFSQGDSKGSVLAGV